MLYNPQVSLTNEYLAPSRMCSSFPHSQAPERVITPMKMVALQVTDRGGGTTFQYFTQRPKVIANNVKHIRLKVFKKWSKVVKFETFLSIKKISNQALKMHFCPTTVLKRTNQVYINVIKPVAIKMSRKLIKGPTPL